MTKTDGKGFAAKHPPGATPDPQIAAAITAAAQKGHLACAKAHEIAGQLNVSPAMVGRALDLMEFRISHCQLGLFGYGGGKKLDKTTDAVPTAISQAITAAAKDGRLPCATAWQIADSLGIGRLTLANACEAMGVRIKPCQLGAF